MIAMAGMLFSGDQTFRSFSIATMTVVAVAMIGSLTVLGMLFGALGAAVVGLWIGRRSLIVVSVVVFSAGMALCALAASPEQLGVYRFVVGLGTGCLMPVAGSLVIDYSPTGKRGLHTALGLVGVAVGGCFAGLLGAWIAPDHGFRPMFAIGAVAAVLVLPALWLFLPNTKRETDTGSDGSGSGSEEGGTWAVVRRLFSRQWITATSLFIVAVGFCLLIIFGAAAFLPTLMIRAGYGVSSSLAFLLVLNVGAVVGALAASPVADKVGFKSVTIGSFLAAAVAFSVLALQPPSVVAVLLIAVVGLGTTGTQILLVTYIGQHYPQASRTAALGVALGVGRVGGILGPTYGAMVATNFDVNWQFVAFAVPAAVGAALIALVPRRSAHRAKIVDAPVVQQA